MGTQPAVPRDWRNQMGRDAAAVGPGMIKHLGRVSRQRVQPQKRKRLTNTPVDLPGWEAADPLNDSGTLSMSGGSVSFTPGSDSPARLRLIGVYFQYSVSASLDPDDIGQISIAAFSTKFDHSLIAPGITSGVVGGSVTIGVAMPVEISWEVDGLASLSGDIGSWFIAVEANIYTGEAS